ncbi:MAG: DedA family protein [Sphingobacteriales bacterium]|nr:MAG: DedA family protein [Sphingobacteriales bacterium]
MVEWLHDFKEFINPEHIIQTGGFVILMLVIFAETGLFFGFFFPGDSLLFTAGLLASTKPELLDTPIILLLLGLTAAGIAGNFVGYWFGSSMGARLFKKEDSLIFKKKYITMTEGFYERYGRMALIAGRFLPIIRTFAPIMAGVIKMDFKKFIAYNIIGSVLWIFSFTLAGYFLGMAFPQIKNYLEYIIIGLVIITIIPVIRTYLRERKKYDAKVLREQQEQADL